MVRLLKEKGNTIMGLAASQGRLLMLTARKSDIEFKIQVINQRRTTLAQQTSQLIRGYVNGLYQTDDTSTLYTTTTTNPDGTTTTTQNDVGALPGFVFDTTTTQTSVGTGDYEQQLALVESLDKELELRTRDLDTQHKEVETEYDAVKKVIDKNIETSFKTLG